MGRRRYTDEQLLQAWEETGSLRATGLRLGLSVGGRSTGQLAERLAGLGVVVVRGPRLRVLDDAERLAQAAAQPRRWRRSCGASARGRRAGRRPDIGRRLRSLGIDTSHFTGQAHARGRPSRARRAADELLVLLPPGSARPRGHLLRRALLDLGREYRCALCGLADWQGARLTLHVDHGDGDWLDNRPDNLRFACPNCHAQTATSGRRRPPAPP